MVVSRQFVVSHDPATDAASFGRRDKSRHMGVVLLSARETFAEEGFQLRRGVRKAACGARTVLPPALSGQRLTGRIVAARPKMLRRQSKLGGDDRLHCRPGPPQGLAGGGWMIPMCHGKPGEAEPAFFQGRQYIGGVPVRGV